MNRNAPRKTPEKAVAYYRVSTEKQGRSGLGLEAQETAVRAWAEANRVSVVESFQETESGKRHENRPALKLALALCKRTGARLVIAKLDRLARNVHFISGLMETPNLKFTACDLPEASEFTLHIMAAVAQMEARMISERTKVALAVVKSRGKLLGGAREKNPYKFSLEQRKKGIAASADARVKAREADDIEIRPKIVSLRKNGATLRQIASTLNEQNYVTRRQHEWTATQVCRILKRA